MGFLLHQYKSILNSNGKSSLTHNSLHAKSLEDRYQLVDCVVALLEIRSAVHERQQNVRKALSENQIITLRSQQYSYACVSDQGAFSTTGHKPNPYWTRFWSCVVVEAHANVSGQLIVRTFFNVYLSVVL